METTRTFLPAWANCAAAPVAKATVYKIATDTTFAPFEFQNKDGNYVGIDIEILAAIATIVIEVAFLLY